MKQNLLRKLYVDELKNIYSAESQLVKAFSNMAKAATSSQLRGGFEGQLRKTREHVACLAMIFEDLDESPKGKRCEGMGALIKEGSKIIAEDPQPREVDARLISTAQRVEHYEMAVYGCARTYAALLGEDEAIWVLEHCMKEVRETGVKFTDLTETLIIEAMELEDPTPVEKGFRMYKKSSAT